MQYTLGPKSEGAMPLEGNRGQICFSWVLASQDPIQSNNCRADGLPGYMYTYLLKNKKAIKALGMKRKIGHTLMF